MCTAAESCTLGLRQQPDLSTDAQADTDHSGAFLLWQQGKVRARRPAPLPVRMLRPDPAAVHPVSTRSLPPGSPGRPRTSRPVPRVAREVIGPG